MTETATLSPAVPGAATPKPQGGLDVISIAKSYDKRAVLTDISVSVAKGEVLGLLGPNGAGKTTCFYSIMGLVRPDSGRILMDGVDVTNLPMYRRAILGLGYLPQETSIFRGMTVEQNIACVLELAEPDAAVRAQELERLLEEFGLTRLRSSAAMALSGVSGGAARLPGRWPPIRRSCCSTNPSPGSIRFRSPISATSCSICAIAGSGC